jgi:hypothetical protein
LFHSATDRRPTSLSSFKKLTKNCQWQRFRRGISTESCLFFAESCLFFAPHGPRTTREPSVGLSAAHSGSCTTREPPVGLSAVHSWSAAVFLPALHLPRSRHGGGIPRQFCQCWRRHHVSEPHANPRPREGLQRWRPGLSHCSHPQGVPAGVCGRCQAWALAVHGDGTSWASRVS